MVQMIDALPHVSLEPPGRQYAELLPHSKTALIYGGYNSITDVLSLNIPAIVLLRNMQDEEQQQHMQRLNLKTKNQLHTIPEHEATAEALEHGLRCLLVTTPTATGILLNGAQTAAQYLARMLETY